jgi:hypothetical protein
VHTVFLSAWTPGAQSAANKAVRKKIFVDVDIWNCGSTNAHAHR